MSVVVYMAEPPAGQTPVRFRGVYADLRHINAVELHAMELCFRRDGMLAEADACALERAGRGAREVTH